MNPADYVLLVVDDNAENRDMLSRRLERKGFSVRSAADGFQALELVDKQRIDLVLLDIMMPGISGLEVLKALRASRSAAELPVIMQTAKVESEDVIEALELGANDYVTKPLDFPVVLARVHAQLRMRPAEKPAEPALTTAQIQPGLVLAERYRLESEIGSGSFGTVYKARHLELERPVAVKILQANVANSAEALARFRREGITACRVKHPNAVSVLDFGVSSGGVAYLVMELLEGHSLLDELHSEGLLSHQRSVAVLVPVCHVLAEAHAAGVVHRDIKPSNIFLQRTPRGEVTKVLDFGIAKIAGAGATGQDLTSAGSVLGTLAYMAPERFGPHALDGKSDVYSLGITLFQMLAGRPPFVAAEAGDPMALVMMHVSQAPPSLRELNPAVPTAVEAVVMQTLRKQPALRPTAGELAEQLAATLGPGAAVAEPGPAPSALGAQRADSATRIAVPGDTSAFPPGRPKDPTGE